MKKIILAAAIAAIVSGSAFAAPTVVIAGVDYQKDTSSHTDIAGSKSSTEHEASAGSEVTASGGIGAAQFGAAGQGSIGQGSSETETNTTNGYYSYYYPLVLTSSETESTTPSTSTGNSSIVNNFQGYDVSAASGVNSAQVLPTGQVNVNSTNVAQHETVIPVAYSAITTSGASTGTGGSLAAGGQIVGGIGGAGVDGGAKGESEVKNSAFTFHNLDTSNTSFTGGLFLVH